MQLVPTFRRAAIEHLQRVTQTGWENVIEECPRVRRWCHCYKKTIISYHMRLSSSECNKWGHLHRLFSVTKVSTIGSQQGEGKT